MRKVESQQGHDSTRFHLLTKPPPAASCRHTDSVTAVDAGRCPGPSSPSKAPQKGSRSRLTHPLFPAADYRHAHESGDERSPAVLRHHGHGHQAGELCRRKWMERRRVPQRLCYRGCVSSKAALGSPLKVHVCNWFRWILELKQGRLYNSVLICCPESSRRNLSLSR